MKIGPSKSKDWFKFFKWHFFGGRLDKKLHVSQLLPRLFLAPTSCDESRGVACVWWPFFPPHAHTLKWHFDNFPWNSRILQRRKEKKRSKKKKLASKQANAFSEERRKREGNWERSGLARISAKKHNTTIRTKEIFSQNPSNFLEEKENGLNFMSTLATLYVVLLTYVQYTCIYTSCQPSFQDPAKYTRT